MARFHNMVPMTLTTEEKIEKIEEMEAPPILRNIPDVPYGLRISLTHVELEKLGLDAECEVGDMIPFYAMAEVTSVRKNKTDAGDDICIELSITEMEIEDAVEEAAE